ncbi:uncharacterized protein Dvir_GJ23126 [Drosophila virilis]|uniref:BPTI/Kunitz inhibitor domain-containing protein n=1 Tax=Drosophila virilis TaxID=7244 RepID=B4M0R0_DROVI|nr:U-actitoxin-Avd3l isoform X1 [Drosophila virilis]EDW67352.2 uncharacterized protein Dvir_GJ23126 [Drosophila virilis]
MKFVLNFLAFGLVVEVSSLGYTREPFVKNLKCLFRVNPGPCKGKFEMFGYDPFARQCSKFFYSGCGGNPNRFGSEVECRHACKKLVSVDEYEDYEYTDDQTDITFPDVEYTDNNDKNTDVTYVTDDDYQSYEYQ